MEPLFRAYQPDDPDFKAAHAMCSRTINQFVECVKNTDGLVYMAKLCFRDPDLSEKEGKDHLFYLWLSEVLYHPNDHLLSGVFFEVPQGFEKWHPIGQRLGFVPEDVFDWMTIDANRRMKGGFSIRIARSRLGSEEEQKKFDEDIGVVEYLPI